MVPLHFVPARHVFLFFLEVMHVFIWCLFTVYAGAKYGCSGKLASWHTHVFLPLTQMAEDVFGVLSEPKHDNRSCENKLVALLEHDKFDTIKKLLKNRWKVVYCIRLARCKDESERRDVEEEMRGNAQLAPILEALHRSGAGAAGSKARVGTTAGAAGGKQLPTSTNSATAMAMAKAGGSVAAPAVSSVKGKAMLDLDSLAFAQGSHFMSNQNCKLPDGTYTVDKKGYQEVHVPALKTADMSPSEHLVQISDLPEWSHKAFAGMKTLNRVQSRLYQTALLSAENLLLCAPTGAGKTNVAMLTILREIGLHRNEDGSINKDAFKIVYVAPMKSLVREMVGNFSQRLEPYGLQVKELSGDQQLTKQQYVRCFCVR
jgi:pre-mRNA-splicing helicase BRR2